MGRLSNRVAVVTGAAQGIGATYAKALAAEGALVCASDLTSPDTVVEEIRKAGGRAIACTTDVTVAASVTAMMERTAAEFGEIHILVNNAAIFGVLRPKPFLQIDSEEWDRVSAVNIRGSFECAKAAIPYLTRHPGGKIINIASGTVFMGQPMLMHYVASKGAIVAMTRSMARELGDTGICVNCIAPGLTLSENVRKNFDPTRLAANVSVRAFKREQVPYDLVGTLVFLASRDSDFMTGQTLVVDGGAVMH